MKKIYKYIGMFAFAGILFTSCENSDDGTGKSIINYTPTTVTLTSDMNNLIVDESSLDPDAPMMITITGTIPEPLPIDLHIPLTTLVGTNGGWDDFSIDNNGEIVILSSATSGSATVSILRTGDIEGDEALVIGAGAVVANAKVNPFTLNVNITNDYINPELDLILAWDGSAEDGDVTIESFCGIDFDLILYDDAFGYLGYVLGSADCPEHDVLSGLPDGTYYLVTDLYSNPFSGLGFTDTIPLSLSWSQEYFPDTVGTITSDAYNLSMTSGLGGMIVVLEVANGYEYTLSPF